MTTISTSLLDSTGSILLEHTSNDPLTDAQKRYVEVALDKLQADKQFISNEVSRVQFILDDLQLRLKETSVRIMSCRGMISPLKYIPNEILSRIFEEYAAGLPNPPWLVGHICSRWREVALAIPSLWNNVVIRVPGVPTFERDEVLFHRSGSCPISFTLALDTSALKASREDVALDFPEFTHYASRLHHVSLDLSETFLPILQQPAGRLSSLESLTLRFPSRGQPSLLAGDTPSNWEKPWYDTIILFENSPRLRRFSISAVLKNQWIRSNILPLLRLPWGQLTHLYLTPLLLIEEGALSVILQRCPNLVQCRISTVYRRRGTTFPTLIKLNNLEALEIVYTSVGQTPLLRRLAFPSLKRLIINSLDGMFLLPLDDIAASILGSGCELEVFHARSHIQLDSALVLLKNIPSLTELTIRGIPILCEVLKGMTCDGLLPNVRFIECRSGEVSDVTAGELVEALGEEGFVKHLWGGNVPISVHIMTNAKRPISHLLDNPKRSSLKISFQQIQGSLYDTEYELSA